jgi:hypothetical protein
MNYCYSTSELKWSGKHDSHVLISWFQARRLGFFGFSPINWRMAEGFHPKPLTRRFYLFSRQGTATQCFTIHKMVPTAGIAPAAFSFASCCSVCSSYAGMVETVRVALTTACLQDRLASTEHASPKSGTPARSPTRISRIRSAALL